MQNASAAFFVDANLYLDVHRPATETVESVNVDVGQHPGVDGLAGPVERAALPSFCELLMCLLVEPKFQEDRLADYSERFNDLWMPKFGQRVAVAVYVWHGLRQSRLIDWLVRTFG